MYLLAGCALLFAACNHGDDSDNFRNEDEESGKDDNSPEIIDFAHANLIYWGTQDEEDVSCLFEISLYTDMEINYDKNPIGPGKIMRLSMNAPLFKEGTTDFPLPEGTFVASAATYVFDEWTFNPGYAQQTDLPTGTVTTHGGTFYGDVMTYSTDYAADILNIGTFTVKRNEDATYTVSGWAAGNSSIKRHFTYTGPLETIDRHTDTEKVPNSTLTQDLTLTTLTKARLQDKGNNYLLEGDARVRSFALYLAEESINLENTIATGDGQLLFLDFFVPWETDVKQGIPAGTYTVIGREATSDGIPRELIKPFRIASGFPNRFTYIEGTWYQKLKNGVMENDYARIDAGTMSVERGADGSHKLTIDFIDSNKEQPHHVRCVYSQQEAIEVSKDKPIINE